MTCVASTGENWGYFICCTCHSCSSVTMFRLLFTLTSSTIQSVVCNIRYLNITRLKNLKQIFPKRNTFTSIIVNIPAVMIIFRHHHVNWYEHRDRTWNVICRYSGNISDRWIPIWFPFWTLFNLCLIFIHKWNPNFLLTCFDT